MNGNETQQRSSARPGAMTMAMRAVQQAPSGPKVLRIGIIQGGKVVEERIVRRRETVSIGSSERNHFIIQAPGLQSRFDMFQLVGGDYILNFTDQMRGRVTLPGGGPPQELERLRASGGARNAGTHWQVKLNDNSRGNIVIGDTRLLFQFVVPPPVQPRPQLPAAARGGFVAGIDWLFTAFVVFSYMIFFGFVVYLDSADWKIPPSIAERARQSQFVLAEPPPPPEESTEVTEEPAEEAAEEEAPAPTKQASGERPSQQESNAEATARIREEARANAEALLLAAMGPGGALDDVLAGGAVTSSAADVLAQAQGVGVATSQGGQLRTRSGGGSGLGGDLGSLRAAGGEGATSTRGEGGEVVERVIRGRVNIGGGDAIGGSGEFDQSLVVQMIRSRQSAFRRCYETSLRNNPTLSGRVGVQFTIQPQGNVSGARATENSTGDEALSSCVVRVIAGLRWREGPTGGSVSFSYPFVFAPQN
jgi:TonB family protein